MGFFDMLKQPLLLVLPSSSLQVPRSKLVTTPVLVEHDAFRVQRESLEENNAFEPCFFVSKWIHLLGLATISTTQPSYVVRTEALMHHLYLR